MLTTKLVINIEAKSNYTEKEIQNLSEQICNFLAGPEGEGLVIGSNFNGDDKKFQVMNAQIKRPEQLVWAMNVLAE